jgi:hypothetical protein
VFTIVLLYVLGMSLAILAARLYTRRPLTPLDVACSKIDAELSAPRVERERVAA